MKSDYPRHMIVNLAMWSAPLLVGLSLPIILSGWYQGYVSQSYYDFADQRTLLGIPNFWNVVSSLLFVVLGWTGWRASRIAPWKLLFAGSC